MDTITKETFAELFTLHVRGVIAAAHALARIEPDARSWAILRGERDATMRDIGEIADALGFRPDIALFARQSQEGR